MLIAYMLSTCRCIIVYLNNICAHLTTSLAYLICICGGFKFLRFHNDMQFLQVEMTKHCVY